MINKNVTLIEIIFLGCVWLIGLVYFMIPEEYDRYDYAVYFLTQIKEVFRTS